MVSDYEIINHQKAAMFDLISLLKQQGKESYTLEEIEAAINAYFAEKTS